MSDIKVKTLIYTNINKKHYHLNCPLSIPKKSLERSVVLSILRP